MNPAIMLRIAAVLTFLYCLGHTLHQMAPAIPVIDLFADAPVGNIPKGGQNWTPIEGQFCTPLDTYLVIDGTDGRAHYVEIADPDQLEDIRRGSSSRSGRPRKQAEDRDHQTQ